MAEFIVDPKNLSQTAIRDALETYISDSPDSAKWKGFFESLVGQSVIELLSGTSAFLAYQTTVGRRENYLKHILNRSSGVAISEGLGYSVYRGNNDRLQITFTPNTTGLLERYSLIGSVKDKDIVLLEDTPITDGVQVTVNVVIGDFVTEDISIETNSLSSFRFTTPASDDIRLLLNGTEVEYSERIIDLENEKFALISNPLGSVDVSYLNQDDYAVKYTIGDVLSINTVTLEDIEFDSSDLLLFDGTIDSYVITKEYLQAETKEQIQVNAPLAHETQTLVRAREDFLKIFKFLDTRFVDTNQRDITTAKVELVYLMSDFLGLTQTEKDDLLQEISKYLPMGIPLPSIADPVRVNQPLTVNVTKQDNSGNTPSDVRAILAERENKFAYQLSLSDLEADIEALPQVKIARVTLGSGTEYAPGQYESGDSVTTTQNSLTHKVARLVYKSGDTEPTWPLTVGETIEDGGILWRANFTDYNNPVVTTWSAETDYLINSIVVPTVPNARQYEAVGFLNRSFGNDEIQQITFDVVPDSGTWRIHIDDKYSTDLAFDATALDVQNAINNMECYSEVEVTGDYTSGFTVTFTGADGNKQVSEISFADPGLDENQQITFDVVPNSGSFGLNFDGQVTAPIPYTATASDIKTALEGLSNVDLVDVTGNFSSGFTVVFRGVNAKTPVPQLTEALLASTGVNEIQTISFDLLPDAGTWRIHLGDEYTSDMPYNAPVLTIQSELNSLEALSGASVSGNYSTGIIVEYTGEDGNKSQPLLEVDNPGRNDQQKILFSLPPDLGTWVIEIEDEKTSPLQHNASHLDIKTALEALSTVSEVTVSGDYASGIVLEFTGSNGLQNVELAVVDDPGADEVQTISFDNIPENGSFSLDFDSQVTGLIDFDATASEIETELELLSNIDQVSVSGSIATGLSVVFQGSNSRVNVPQMTIGTSTLSYNTTAERFNITTLADSGGNLDAKSIRLYENGTDAVVFWFDVDNTGTPPPAAALSASRHVKVSTVVTNDSATLVANKLADAINSDPSFSATFASNVVDALSLQLGPTTDFEDVDTGFTFFQTQNGAASGVNATISTLVQGYDKFNYLTRFGNPITISSEKLVEGLLPAESLTSSGSPVANSIVETQTGEDPVSNLQNTGVPVNVSFSTPIDGRYPANNLTNSLVPVEVTVTTIQDAANVEPEWPLVVGERVYDGDIIWQTVLLNGTPDEWQPGTVYSVGDYVKASELTVDVDDNELMFQVVGHVGKSLTEPTFPSIVEGKVVDNNIEWEAVDTLSDPDQLEFNQYYKIDETVNIT